MTGCEPASSEPCRGRSIPTLYVAPPAAPPLAPGDALHPTVATAMIAAPLSAASLVSLIQFPPPMPGQPAVPIDLGRRLRVSIPRGELPKAGASPLDPEPAPGVTGPMGVVRGGPAA